MNYHSTVIDAMNMAYRSWWPVKDLCTPEGVRTGLEFGFIKNLLSQIRNAHPGKLVLAWDGRPTRCLDLYPEYKAGRVKPQKDDVEPPWPPRLERLMQVLSNPFTTLYGEDTEADEQIARFAKKQEVEGNTTLIYSTDDDMKQLVSELTHVHTWREGPYTPEAVEEKFGVPVEKLILLKAISGDSSDNIPGVKRIPADIKQRLVNESSDLEDMLRRIDHADFFRGTQKQKLIDGKDIIRRNYILMNLRDDTEPPTLLEGTTGDCQEVVNLCEELQLESLVARKEWSLVEGSGMEPLEHLEPLEGFD